MKVIIPDYYPEFHCIADRCRHSCCIGWEIDIDPAMRERYRRVPGPFGDRLNAAIQEQYGQAFFALGENERCPMLNESGLCDLITELGEDHLCQICADHPRFRSFFHGMTEVGLGLCCEEAARLILTRRAPMRLIPLLDDGAPSALDEEEEALLAIRDILLHDLADHSRSLEERLEGMLKDNGLPIPDLDWQEEYRALERLDPAWDAVLDTLDLSSPAAPPAGLESAFEQFASYLLFRHLPGAMQDEDIPGRVAFCVLSTRILMRLCAARPDCTMADCIELARMYSAEIEYSDENMAVLLEVLWSEADDEDDWENDSGHGPVMP